MEKSNRKSLNLEYLTFAIDFSPLLLFS